jgi:hypothetical protein
MAQKMNAPKITFFMLVTNRDVSIADYAAKSYARIQPDNVLSFGVICAIQI